MKVVVDTNIVFASLQTLHSATRNRLLSRAEEWYAPCSCSRKSLNTRKIYGGARN